MTINSKAYFSKHSQWPPEGFRLAGLESLNTGKMVVMGHQLEKLVGNLKAKLKSLKGKKPYDKMGKTESMRVEIRSKRAQKESKLMPMIIALHIRAICPYNFLHRWTRVIILSP
ncbi:hypothetical protein C4D60_Mb03t09940 [Musa balbisiana]|uniref:Uncharacterized protein n=1 Tax=Musa balbisiana TaxID=52838 RepID=A0A4S8J8T7_MUSBA|nr:hypothetical protein C4D60_Mb03t09940 [Musa balbisiana]